MEFPFGHQKHHSHHHSQEEEEEPPHLRQPNRPPPRSDYPFQQPEDPEFQRPHYPRREEDDLGDRFERTPPPRDDSYSDFPPQSETYPRPDFRPPPRPMYEPERDPDPVYSSVHHVAHEVKPGFEQGRTGFGPPQSETYPHPDFHPPPRRMYEQEPELEPVYSSVQHVAHEVEPGFEQSRTGFGRGEEEHHHRHNPTSVFHHSHEKNRMKEGSGSVANKPSVKVYCKAGTGYSLTIQEGKVVLTRSDPNDEFQHWVKDEKYSTRVKDAEGFPCFALVNKATGQAIKHSIGASHPVQLCPYDPDILDESVLWTESRDTGDGYRAVRMVNNIRLNLDAFHGDAGVHDGTTLVLWDWNKGENQRWKIVPH